MPSGPPLACSSTSCISAHASVTRRLRAHRGHQPDMPALRGLAILLLLQAAGEALARALALPFPGPVIGLVLLLPLLNIASLREPVTAAAKILLTHLSLLFVPVGVGVVAHLSLLSQHGIRLIIVIVLSTWIGMAVTALALQMLLKRKGQVSRG
jgi:holin-like protein